MIKANSCLLCESVIRDADTNIFSIIAIMDTINSPTYPLFLHKLGGFVSLERDEGDPKEIDIEILLISGETKFFSAKMKIYFKEMKRTRAVVSLHGIIVPNPGPAKFECRYEGTLLNCFNFDFAQVEGVPQLKAKSPDSHHP